MGIINVKFDVYFKRELGTLFKSNEVDLDGLEANVNLDLDLVENMKINYLINGNKLTDDIVVKDIEKRLILIPFKSEVRVGGEKIQFEIQANMKNGDVKVSQTYAYDVEMGIGEGTQVGTGGSGDGHTHSNLSTLNKVTESKLREWDNKSNFSGSYNDLTNKPTDLATESYVNQKIAEASLSGGEVDLSAYATIEFVEQEINSIELTPGPKGDKGDTGPQGLQGPKGDKGDPGTTSWNDLQDKPAIPSIEGLATESYVQEKIAEASLSGGEVDLSAYATKAELNTKADKSHTHNELHSHSNKTVLDGITSTKVTEWNNKSNFDGDYNSLSNKPIIPTVDVNKNYVDIQLATKANVEDIPSLDGYATETYVKNKIAEASLSGGGSSNILNKIEILENDPVDDLFEGRIWVVVNNNVSTPVISLHSYEHNSITIKLDVASYNQVCGNIQTYELYNDDVLLESEVINISQGGTYKINNLTPETTYNIKLKGILNNNKSEFSNTVNVTTQPTPQVGDIPTDGLAVFLKGSDFTNSPQTTVLYDLSGNNNHAAANGFNYTINSGSDGNGNIVFDGSGDKIVIPQSESISATNGFTLVFKGSIDDLGQSNKEIIELLIKPWGAGGGEQITLIYGYVSKTLELYGDRLAFRGGSQITINDTNIHTIIYTYDGANLYGYLDGVEVVNVSKSVSITSPIQSTSIGANSNGNKFAKIKLRHYLFYNRWLTADEVAAVENGLL